MRPSAAGGDNVDPVKKNWLDAFAPGNGTQLFRLGGDKGASEGGFGTIFGTKKSGGTKSSADVATVLVAGATGRLGARVVRELLARGFRVRAGVRNPEKAEQLESLAPSFGPLTQQEASRLTIVYLDLEDPDTILPALGRASSVVCAVGAAESEFTDLTAPKRIDFEGSTALVEAAAASGVQRFILVTSLGTGKLGFPAGLLNAFGGVLTFKRKTEEALEKSGMIYTIVRPGGMERPKDDYKEKNNVRLAKRDTLFGGQVSRLQVAELIGAALESPDLAVNKCLEVVAEPTAPALSYEDLLAGASIEISQEERLERLAAERAIEADLEEAAGELEEAKQRLANIREAIADLSREAAEAKSVAKTVQKEEAAVIKEAQRAEAEVYVVILIILLLDAAVRLQSQLQSTIIMGTFVKKLLVIAVGSLAKCSREPGPPCCCSQGCRS